MKKTILITGGAGFIGVNSASAFARKGWKVLVLDNLSRAGSPENLAWLRQQHPEVEFIKADIRDAAGMRKELGKIRPEVLLHLAAQVAVTTSVANPREDFEVNALGTLNLLEAVRLDSPGTFVINVSTNKVYGKMAAVGVVERELRYEYRGLPGGVPETQALDLYSPYGCSKGAADQYTLDYARIYGLDTVTLRQSCIYGPRQMGVEDQGWVAWFCIAATLGKPITIYGDGKQVRDVLHIDDLMDCYFKAIDRRPAIRGHAFNIGGGPDHTLSLLEFLVLLERETGRKITRRFSDWRPGDQPVYISDITKAKDVLGWMPEVATEQGMQALLRWVNEHRPLFGKVA